MSLPKQLDTQLAALECRWVERLVFDVPPEHGDMRWRINFKIYGVAKQRVGGAIRYRHRSATDFGWSCVSQLGGPLWNRAEPPPWGFSSGVHFGSMAGWRSDWTIDHSSASTEATSRKIASDVQRIVLPFVRATQSDEALFALLCQDSGPWSWERSQPLVRFAEVACLARRLNVPSSVFLPLAEKHAVQMQDQLDGVNLAVFIDGVLQKAGDIDREAPR